MKSGIKAIIEFQQFEKWYGNINAVKPLDLSIKKGETFTLLGPNGSGKSTVIRALAGLHFPTKGRILINGIDISEKPKDIKKMISYMPQRVNMPGYLTAREVISLCAGLKKVRSNRVSEVIDYVELQGSADRYIREYSGGMLQRIGLAIAFLDKDSEIYLLDEPTLNLDPLGIKRFREFILELKQKEKTVLFSSHILQDAVHLADRVGILVDGQMVRIESIPDFREDVTRETTVRIKLISPLSGIQDIIEAAGAQSISGNGRSCIFKAEPKQRLSVIRAIEAAGGIIEEFHTDPPNWETLLHQHFNNHNGD